MQNLQMHDTCSQILFIEYKLRMYKLSHGSAHELRRVNMPKTPGTRTGVNLYATIHGLHVYIMLNKMYLSRAYKTELLASIITLYRQRFSQIFIWLVRQQKGLLYFQKILKGH